MTHLAKNWPNYTLMICLIIIIIILIIITKRSFFAAPVNLAQLNKYIYSIKANFMRYKLLIENNKLIQDLKHGYTSAYVPISPFYKLLLDFEKTLIGKLLKMLGSVSIVITIIFRSKRDISGTILASISDIEPVVTMIAIFGSIYSCYLLIYLFFKLKTSLTYLIKGKWITRREKKNKNIQYEYYYIFFFFTIKY